jgi:5-methylcytosine-specific restriction endonuclease McrA
MWNICSSSINLRDNYCRSCRSEYKQEHYEKNKQRYIDNAAARKRRIIDERMEFIFAYLKERPCADCGEDDLLVLEFDHLQDKSFEITEGIRNRNWESVLAEIEKCEVVCANCHRRRTARKYGFVRATLLLK